MPDRHSKPPIAPRGPTRVTDEQWRDYFTYLHAQGFSKAEAARRAGLSRSTVMVVPGKKKGEARYDPRVPAIEYAIRKAHPDPVKEASEIALGTPASGR
jgi:hypothetical protein